MSATDGPRRVRAVTASLTRRVGADHRSEVKPQLEFVNCLYGADMEPRIVVAADLTLCKEALKPLEELAKVVYLNPCDRRDVLWRLPDTVAYIGDSHIAVDEEFLNQARRLRVVASFDHVPAHIDCDELKYRQIELIGLSDDDAGRQSLTSRAEVTWTLLLACWRKLPRQMYLATKGNMGIEPGLFPPPQLAGKTLGIYGYDNVGKTIANFGRTFGMTVKTHDLEHDDRKWGDRVDFDTLLRRSDVVSLHVESPHERGCVIDSKALAKMQQGAVLLNTTYGGLVDEVALIRALEAGHIAAAGLDVVTDEADPALSYRPIMEYARTHHNLVITPHIGDESLEAEIGVRTQVINQVADYLAER